MAEMFIDPPLPVVHDIVDYEFLFANGKTKQISINVALGDAIEFKSDQIAAFVAPKLSLDRTKTNPSESVILLTRHVAMISARERKVTQLTPEQQFENLALLGSDKS